MKRRKVISKSWKRYTILINRPSDPAVWVVNVYKKFLLFKFRKSSYWFNDEKQALKFAENKK